MKSSPLAQNVLMQLRQRPNNYAEAKAHSESIDELLGLDFESVEAAVSMHQPKGCDVQNWSGLPIQAMQTPYSEFLEVTEALDPRPGSRWVDLGAAYGRMGIVLGLCRPGVEFIGYELMKERVEEGLRIFADLGLSGAALLNQDLSDRDFELPAADCYFIFDYGSRAAVEKTLEDLKRLARKRVVTVVARGRGCRHWIDSGHPWLSQVIAPLHREHYSIYKSAGAEGLDP